LNSGFMIPQYVAAALASALQYQRPPPDHFRGLISPLEIQAMIIVVVVKRLTCKVDKNK